MNNTPCQDKPHHYIDSNIAIISLCDGAGSAKYSHIGAECVSKEIAQILRENFDKYYMSESMQTKCDIINKLLQKLNEICHINKTSNNQILEILQDYEKALLKNLDTHEICKCIIDEIKCKIRSFETRINMIKHVFGYKEVNLAKEIIKKIHTETNIVNENINNIKELLEHKHINTLDYMQQCADTIKDIYTKAYKDLLTDLNQFKKQYKENKNGSLPSYIMQTLTDMKQFAESYFDKYTTLIKQDDMENEDIKNDLEQFKKRVKLMIKIIQKNKDSEKFLEKLETQRKELAIHNKIKGLEKSINVTYSINNIAQPAKFYELKDLASTLLFVAIKGEQCLIGHLGDGAIGGLYGNELRCISNPDNGEHANETYFVTTKHAEKALKITRGNIKEKDISAFVLMSDGSTEGLYIKKENKFIESLQRHILAIREGEDKDKKQKDIESLIERVKKEKSFDDCSIAILIIM